MDAGRQERVQPKALRQVLRRSCIGTCDVMWTTQHLESDPCSYLPHFGPHGHLVEMADGSLAERYAAHQQGREARCATGSPDPPAAASTGIISPSALAVLRLIISSTLVSCTIGRLLSFASLSRSLRGIEPVSAIQPMRWSCRTATVHAASVYWAGRA